MSEEHKIKINNDFISAIHHKSDSDKWVFLCHGFGGNKDRGNKDRAEFLNQNGWNAVRFDFRGNGDSSGDFIDQNLSSRIKDLKAVVSYFDPDDFAVFGTSFGGKVVFHASLDLEPNCVVGKAPVTYNRIMSRFKAAVENKGEFEYIEGKPIDERFFDDFASYSFEDVEEGLKVPVCVFHGRDDTTVHIENSFEAVENLKDDCMFYSFEGEKHSFSSEAKDELNQLMVYWLELVC